MKSRELTGRFNKKRKANCAGANRVKEIFEKKTVCLRKMIKRAVNKGFKASYILVDAWFFDSKLVQFCLEEKLPCIARVKFNPWLYKYNNRAYTPGKLIRSLVRSKKVKWNRKLKMRFVKVQVEFKGLPVTLIYYKTKGRGAKWHAIATTDKMISAQRAFEIYQIRWTIESSYKELKQHLGFGKCMARDFDAQISDTTNCLMAYNIISHHKAIHDHQSIGHLFRAASQKWLRPNMMQKFWKEFFATIQQLAEYLGKQTDELIELAISKSEFANQMKKLSYLLTTET